MEYVAKEKFLPSEGRRSDVQAVTIVITDGKSYDHVAKPASSLREQSYVS